MWRNKKVIVTALAVALLLVSIGGVAVARAAGDTATGNTTQPKTLPARVAEILGIDQQKVEAAFQQAQSDMQLEAMKNRLQALVSAGKVTQTQADEYLKWYQAKPDMDPYQQQLKNWMQSRPTVPSELKDWQQAKPDVPLPAGPGARGFRGMQRMQGGGGMRLQGTPAQ